MSHQTIAQRKEAQAATSSPARSAFSPRDFGEQAPGSGAGAGHSFSRLSVLRPQTKRTVDEPGDEHEQEADAVADDVLRMSDSESVQRENDDDEETVQARRTESGQADAGDVSGAVAQGLS